VPEDNAAERSSSLRSPRLPSRHSKQVLQRPVTVGQLCVEMGPSQSATIRWTEPSSSRCSRRRRPNRGREDKRQPFGPPDSRSKEADLADELFNLSLMWGNGDDGAHRKSHIRSAQPNGHTSELGKAFKVIFRRVTTDLDEQKLTARPQDPRGFP
jgi:hypothetical protein